MSAHISYNPFVDDNILFASKEDANAWASALVVPTATSSTEGTVFAAVLPQNPTTVATAAYDTITVDNGDNTTTTYNILTQQSVIDLYAQVAELKTIITQLMAALVAAGSGQQ